MALTPDDIVNYPLKQSVRGYSVAQVDDLLDQIADQVLRTTQELEDVRRRLERSERRLSETSETESTLKRTLVTAQRAAEQSVEEAQERADQLIDDARREAERIIEDAQLRAEEVKLESLRSARAEEAEIRRRRRTLESEVEGLRLFEQDYRQRLRSLLEEELQRLTEVGPPPSPEDLMNEDDGTEDAADGPVARVSSTPDAPVGSANDEGADEQ